MSVILDQSKQDKIDYGDTCVAECVCTCGGAIRGSRRQCVCCKKVGFVSLFGSPHPMTRRWSWYVYMGAPVGQPFATLTCASCHQVVTSADRYCQICDVYCCVRLVGSASVPSSWWVQRYVSPDQIYNSFGVRLLVRHTPTNPLVGSFQCDTQDISKVLGWLYCPVFGEYSKREYIEEDHICIQHNIRLNAVLVRGAGGIFVERRADDIPSRFNHIHYRADEIKIAKLLCPLCGTPVIDRDLVCLVCRGHVVDVGLEMHEERMPSGRLVKSMIAVEYFLRSIQYPGRPAGLLRKVGDGWDVPQRRVENEQQDNTREVVVTRQAPVADNNNIESDTNTQTAEICIDDILNKFE